MVSILIKFSFWLYYYCIFLFCGFTSRVVRKLLIQFKFWFLVLDRRALRAAPARSQWAQPGKVRLGFFFTRSSFFFYPMGLFSTRSPGRFFFHPMRFFFHPIPWSIFHPKCFFPPDNVCFFPDNISSTPKGLRVLCVCASSGIRGV